jgi:hypothetical protein
LGQRIQSDGDHGSFCYLPGRSPIESALERIKHLNPNEAEALIEWLNMRQNPEALRQGLDREIEVGLDQLKRGEKISGTLVHSELRERSRKRRAEGDA